MANDKDFILKNSVEVSGPTKVTLGTVTSDNVDLSTGNYFKDTPSGNSTYSISNAGDVQSFQLEVTGGSEAVAENFSTTLYTGTGAAQTITNGIDLLGEGGLAWIKSRTGAVDHNLMDTARGLVSEGGGPLTTTSTSGQGNNAQTITSFNSNGFTVGTEGSVSTNAMDFVSWTFRKAPKFFDVVTYTGDGVAGRTVSHSLGAEVGCLIVKNLNDSENWQVYHRSTGNAERLLLNQTAASGAATTHWNSTTPTSSVFTLGTHNGTNSLNDEYVAYLFAHDTATDSQIKCGSFTADASGSALVGPDLGWEPQWVLLKNATSTANGNWWIFDSLRGFTASGGGTAYLLADSNVQEYAFSGSTMNLTSNGFTMPSTFAPGQTFIYMAIRAASEPDITWPSSIEWAGGIAPSAPAVGETDVFTITTDDGGTSYTGVKTADNLS